MNEQTIALGAAVLMAALILGALLSRWYFAPTGSHRATLMRPQAAEVNDVGWCPAEQQERLHAYHADGSRMCWTCRTRTPGGAS
ncbi:hypothetical protein ACH40E_33335 [Streptomyces acidicola]|uniref:hypothetical protein n=1 Tax=Streptomyces acidicola TaxID=2596892 RepID=UPI0037A81DA6